MECPFTAGRIILRGNVTSRGQEKRADYLLFYKPNIPLAIIEAKDNNYPVPILPLAEQKRIVAKIEEIFPYIEQYDKAYIKLELFNQKFSEDMQKSILQYAMQGKLVEQRVEEGTGEGLYWRIRAEKERFIKEGNIKAEKSLPEILEREIPYKVPQGWCGVRLGELGTYKQGPFGSALTKSLFIPKSSNSVKVYGQKNAIRKDGKIGEYYIAKDYFESKMRGFVDMLRRQKQKNLEVKAIPMEWYNLEKSVCKLVRNLNPGRRKPYKI